VQFAQSLVERFGHEIAELPGSERLTDISDLYWSFAFPDMASLVA
jgi:hypothetical protein